ncbi:hypothetical protein [Nocardia testacea]|uniref:ESX-1 secretion-associated protein EspA/EspE-like domain-containing protein n=1 Tax=Nocardia testacea TaxID=248551 RepID=A0ABW7W0Z8_9NOCA
MAGDDPWGAFRDRAASGGVAFEEAVAQEAAQFAADLVSIFDVVDGVAPLLVPLTKLGPESFSGPERLRAKYDEIAGEFKDDIMSGHRRRVTDLGEAFVLAGKLYQNTDQDAAGTFARMVDGSMAGSLVEHAFAHYDDTDGWVDETYTLVPDPGNYADKNNKFTLPSGLSGLPGSAGAEGFAAEAPPAGGLNFNQFWWLGQEINGAAHFIQDKATYWIRMKIQLDTGFTDFDQGMQGLLDSDRWTGRGVEGATTAVRAYLGSGAHLISAMQQIGDNLLNTSQWILNTAMGMPDKSYAYTRQEGGEAAVHQQETFARQVYANWYEPGVALSSSAIPELVAPTETTGPPANNNERNGGGGGGGGGGGANGGGGPGGADQNGRYGQQQAALQEIDQQRAELLAAQQDLEAQAQAQQAALQQQQSALEQQPEAQQALQAAQQGLQQLGQMGQQLSTAAQQALQQAGITGLPGMPALQDAVKNYQSALQKAGKLPAGLGGGGGAGAGGGPGAAGPKSTQVPNMEKAAKLFPRASLATTVGGAQSAGVAASSVGQGAPMGGMPMGGGGAGGAAQGGQQKDHKRADYLDSTEWLEEGIGEPSVVAKPVVDQ